MDWKKSELGEILSFRNGKSSAKDKGKEDGEYPVYGANGIIARTDAVLEEEPVVIVGRVGAYCGNIQRTESKSWATDNTMIVRAEDADLDFIYYLLTNLNLNKYRTGTSQPLLTQTALKDIETEIPPRREQEKIGRILRHLDEKIQANNEINDILEEMAQSVFKSWFVNFDPYDEFRSADIGDIPKEFEHTTISEFADIILGNSPKSKYYNENEEGLPFFQGSKNFGERYPEKERWCTKEKKIAEEEDVLISIRAPVGDVNRAKEKCIVGRGVTALRMKEFGNEYLYNLLKSSKNDWEKYKSGTTFDSINKTDIKNFPVALPPPEDIKEYNSLIRPMRELIRKNVDENKRLSDLRDILLPKLMSGEIRVNDIELDELEVDSEV